VALWLMARGFCIVARNLRLGMLELDLVARRGPLVVVVEVRTRGRTALTTAFGSIGFKKRQYLQRAARRLWRTRYRHDASVMRLRIDVAAVVLDGPDEQVLYQPGAISCSAPT
jgi:putative endonuclease